MSISMHDIYLIWREYSIPCVGGVTFASIVVGFDIKKSGGSRLD